MTITRSSQDRLEVMVPQPLRELVAFVIFVTVISAAIAFGSPAPPDARPYVVLGPLLLAGAWSAYAAFSSEHYTFDRTIDRYVLARRTPLGGSERAGSIRAIISVSVERGGPYDDRRLVVLVEANRRRHTLPLRITSLSEQNQRELGSALAAFLELPLR